MIQILPKVFAGLGFGGTSFPSGINSGEGTLVAGGGKIPMALGGVARRLTLYGGVVRGVDVSLQVKQNGTTVVLETALAAGAADEQAANTADTVTFSAGDYLEYVFITSDVVVNPGIAIAACLEIEADAMLFGLSPQAGTIAVNNGWIGGALGNGILTSYSGDPSALGSSYSICALASVLERICLKRFGSQTGGAWTAWIILNGVIQDGTGGTVDTTTILDDADPDFVVGTFSLPLAIIDHVNVLVLRSGSEAAFATAQVGVGTAVRPNTPGAFMFCGGDNGLIPDALTWKWLESAEGGVAIGDHTAPAGQRPFQVTGLYVEREGAPGEGNAYLHTLIKNGEPAGIVATVTGAVDTSGQSDTGRVQYHAGDTLTLQMEVTGAPSGSAQVHWAFAATLNQGVLGPLAWVHWPRRVLGS